MPRMGKAVAPRGRFDHLLKVIASQRFLKKQGLGNEVPFFICPYPADEAFAMEAMRASLIHQLESRGVRAFEINLYDLSVALLRKRGIWDEVLAAEPSISKDELKELLQGVLDPETHLVPEIAMRLSDQEFDVLFLSGVGEVYPYVRSHNVLNNLQSTAKEQPTVMFFPGTYTHGLATGASLDLFGILHDDKYYRAFNIMHYEI
ncbi:DUF1788 domain-containing protein [Mesorhizobium sp.]|uniref:DUF1788 domain-containing protein n=1 Tax=Mesorhizobium sp. TaxID=1871066 RepID=UPI00257BB05A|nr:DUF1788 domain-containing protein [Mesorhizobium sp.]